MNHSKTIQHADSSFEDASGLFFILMDRLHSERYTTDAIRTSDEFYNLSLKRSSQ
jgi:hypothetical protein